jgi:hypothetical protein
MAAKPPAWKGMRSHTDIQDLAAVASLADCTLDTRGVFRLTAPDF